MMDFKRINENTLMLFLSYVDIEERGFTKDEIWYNREKGEELFWVMMDELEESGNGYAVDSDGPLWIQVVSKESGLELTITTAKLSNDQEDMEAPFGKNGLPMGLPGIFDLDQMVTKDLTALEEDEYGIGQFEFVFEAKDIDEIIHTAERMPTDADVQTALFERDQKYFLYMKFDEQMDVNDRFDIVSIALECLTKSNTTIHVLQEYGNTIIENDVFHTIRLYF